MDFLPGKERRRASEVQDEVQFYLEARARELQEQGMPEHQAWAEAREAFGDVAEIEAEVLAIHRGTGRMKMRGEWWHSLWRDVRLSARSLKRSPTFTVVALLTLALGLGANTAMYSLVDAALFRAPPVEDPDELVAVYTTSRRGFPRSSTSYPDFLDYRSQATLLDGLAATASLPASMGHDAQGARFVSLEMVTGDYFPLLGASPARGRLIAPSDDDLGAGASVIVLSYDLWQTHFLGEAGVVGSQVRLNGASFTVIGVADVEFSGMRLSFRPDAWIPMQAGPYLGQGSVARPDVWETRGGRWMGMLIGRRREGATTDQVRAQFVQISEGLKAEYGDQRGSRNTTVDDLSTYALPNGAEEQMAAFVWLLLGVVGFSLLLACANLANLLLARAAARSRDVAVRLALGAKRGHLVRQLLTESLLVALIGGAAGLLVAKALLAGLGRFELPGSVSIQDLGATLDGGVLAVSLVAAVFTGLLFGLLPTLQATRPGVVGLLHNDSGKGSRPTRSLLRKGLVAMQVALCLVLLIGSGLFVTTLREGLAHDLGFESEGIALARFNLGLLNYQPADGIQFLESVTARLEERPGVESVSASTRVPLQDGGAQGFFVEIPGYQPRPDEELRIDMIGATPGYFESLGIPLVAGRGISDVDVPGGREVVVVSRSMADAYWPGANPLDRTVIIGQEVEATVVGVAEDVTWLGLDDEPTNYVYYPLAMSPDWSTRFVTLAVRTADPEGALLAIRDEVLALEPDAPITFLHTMREQVRGVMGAQEMGAVLLSGLGLVALLLAAIGITGVVAYSVNQKRREIGIRMALGAERRRVVGQIVLDMAVPVALGVAVGIVGAVSLTRLVEGFLFGVSPTDFATYATVTAVFVLVAGTAAFVPARSASRVNPTDALRAE